MTTPYIPNTDAAFRDWVVNFAALITADPTAYGLIPADAVIIQGVADDYDAAYVIATDPATRTAPTVATKDSTRAAAEAVARPYAMQVNNNAGVSDAQRANLGLTIRKTVPTPVPAPTSAPALELVNVTPQSQKMRYSDTGAGSGKAKPYGAIGVELFTYIGPTAISDPSAASYAGTYTKSPFSAAQLPANAGQMATHFARFVTRSGPAGRSQTGPWSAPLSAIIA